MRRRRRPTLHHAVKDKRVTVLGPVKQPEMDFMSHRGEIATSTTSKRQLLGAADAHTAHQATTSTAPAHQPLGSANVETTPARAPAAAADRTQRPDATCEGKNG